MTQKVKVTIKGISPLLMHAYPMVPVEAIEKKTKEEQAEISAYRDPDGKLYVPGVAIRQTLVNAASYSKGSGRSKLTREVAACVLVDPERVLLNQKEYTIDSRPVVIKATKGRIMRHRPRFDTWELDFDVEWDETLISEVQLRKIVDDAGSRVGLLDFRPANKGPFGRFMVSNWKVCKK